MARLPKEEVAKRELAMKRVILEYPEKSIRDLNEIFKAEFGTMMNPKRVGELKKAAANLDELLEASQAASGEPTVETETTPEAIIEEFSQEQVQQLEKALEAGSQSPAAAPEPVLVEDVAAPRVAQAPSDISFERAADGVLEVIIK